MLSDLFTNITVAGIPLLLIVLGLVQFVKSFGISGQIVRGISLLIGFLLGVGYQFSTTPPADFSGWFSCVVFGLGLGLVASGDYDALKQIATGVKALIGK